MSSKTETGMGFIHSAECDIMHNSALINIHMIDTTTRMGAPRNFAKARIKSLGWEAETSLKEGVSRTYAWIEQQVKSMQERRPSSGMEGAKE